jgi:hypothetical protein
MRHVASAYKQVDEDDRQGGAMGNRSYWREHIFLGMGPIKNATCFMNVVRRSVEDSVI